MLRKIIFAALILSITSAIRPHSVNAQCGGDGPPSGSTNVGTEFLLAFEQNDVVDRSSLDGGYLEIYLSAVSAPATVTITSRRYPALSRTIHLNAGGAYTYRITDDTVQYHSTPLPSEQLSDLWITSHDQADSRVVRVSSDAPIICYGMNHKDATSDAFLALPLQSSGTEYRIMSYGTSENPEPRSSEFAVAAFADNTKVTIIPSAATSGGTPAGAPVAFTLNAGESVQIQAPANILGADLTGSEVRSSAPVAVYGGHVRAEVPLGFITMSGSTSRNHLIEAMPKTASWGRGFVLDALAIDGSGKKRPEGDLMRVLALNDNTVVKVNGIVWTTLGHDRHADTAIYGPTVVETSGPALVAEYAHTSTTDGGFGDPFMAIVPSVDQMFNDYTFFASTDPIFSVQNVIIAADITSATSSNKDSSSIIFDNDYALNSAYFKKLPTQINGRQFALTQWNVQPGAHRLSTGVLPENGFNILMYGLGPVDAYGYTAGILLRPLRALMGHQLPTTIAHRHTNEIDIRNTTNEDVYIMNIRVVPDHPEDLAAGIRIREDAVENLDPIGVGKEMTFHLTSGQPFANAITGTVRIASETPKWSTLDTLVVPFTLYPDAFAAVGASQAKNVTLTNFPNPVISSTTFSFSVNESDDYTLKICDQLGRVVKVVFDQSFPAGNYSVSASRDLLTAGGYTYVLSSRKSGIVGRGSMMIGE